MRSKIWTVLKAVLVLVIGLQLTMGLLYFVDQVSDGLIGSLIEMRYTGQYGWPTEDGTYHVETRLLWDVMKRDAFFLLVLNTLFWLAVVMAVNAIGKRRQRRRIIRNLSAMIHDYIHSELDAGVIFPAHYAQISAEMADIRADMIRKEQILKEETSRKNDLIAYLAHDLKTPLTSIIGYLNLLNDAPDMPLEQRAKYTHITLDKAYRLEKMIDEFFDITRYNLQQIAIQKEPVDLYYLLVQLTDELLPLLASNGNTAVLNAPENLTVSGDPDKLARVFNNVLKNAAAYSYPNTEISIAAREQGHSLVITFTNHGKTIPKEKLSALFEKFYRLDEARNSVTGGAGLGLAIAREIVSLHGGSIFAESANELVTFTIVLPIGLS